MLANRIVPQYRYENCIVLALSDGGAMVGAQIAMALHCAMELLITEDIELPNEPDALGGIAEDGSFSFNPFYSPGVIDEFVSEYFQFIEAEKMTKLQKMHRQIGETITLKKSLLKGHNVILVSDGLKSGFALDIAASFLKPIAIEKMIIATPLASVKAVDRMHAVADELYVLSVIDEYISTEHYYDIEDVPEHKAVVDTVQRIIMNWH
ncbi:MAG: phosphoribosyltransferase family protein [Candidatus Saccharimonadales bacterium]